MSNSIKNHISFETAKLLKDCGIESENSYQKQFALSYYTTIGKNGYGLKDKILREIGEDVEYPAFSWQEILWKYEEEFFENGEIVKHTQKILLMLQAKMYQEADLYFRKNCILNK